MKVRHPKLVPIKFPLRADLITQAELRALRLSYEVMLPLFRAVSSRAQKIEYRLLNGALVQPGKEDPKRIIDAVHHIALVTDTRCDVEKTR